MRAAGFKAADIELIPGKNLVDEIWQDRPKMPQEAVWVLEDKYAGESVKAKFERIAAKMDGADLMIVTTLDDIAWILNLRGNDISFNPLFFSYVILHNKTADAPYKVDLFISKAKVAAADVSQHLAENNVTVHEYD
jgi:Xaa-Pro aminopeptidase